MDALKDERVLKEFVIKDHSRTLMRDELKQPGQLRSVTVCEDIRGKLAAGAKNVFTYVFGEAEVPCDLGFEYAVLPQVGVEAICCLCNLHETKKKHPEKNVH